MVFLSSWSSFFSYIEEHERANSCTSTKAHLNTSITLVKQKFCLDEWFNQTHFEKYRINSNIALLKSIDNSKVLLSEWNVFIFSVVLQVNVTTHLMHSYLILWDKFLP